MLYTGCSVYCTCHFERVERYTIKSGPAYKKHKVLVFEKSHNIRNNLRPEIKNVVSFIWWLSDVFLILSCLTLSDFFVGGGGGMMPPNMILSTVLKRLGGGN